MPLPTTFRLLLAIVAVWASPARAETLYLHGRIGDFPVNAVVERAGDKLDGWYFYHSRAKLIRLEGRLTSGNAFTLAEHAEGKKTAVFEGTVAGGRWTGRWSKSDGASSLPFEWQENRQADAAASLRGDCSLSERVAAHGYTYRWRLKLDIAGGKVRTFTSTQGAYYDGDEEQTCSIGLRDLRRTADKEAVAFAAGTCRIRVIVDAKIAWIRFGDGSAGGGDCRGADDTMFCSPRAFWNDMVIDLASGKCKAVR